MHPPTRSRNMSTITKLSLHKTPITRKRTTAQRQRGKYRNQRLFREQIQPDFGWIQVLLFRPSKCIPDHRKSSKTIVDHVSPSHYITDHRKPSLTHENHHRSRKTIDDHEYPYHIIEKHPKPFSIIIVVFPTFINWSNLRFYKRQDLVGNLSY